jgi:hypothetical protein
MRNIIAVTAITAALIFSVVHQGSPIPTQTSAAAVQDLMVHMADAF